MSVTVTRVSMELPVSIDSIDMSADVDQDSEVSPQQQYLNFIIIIYYFCYYIIIILIVF